MKLVTWFISKRESLPNTTTIKHLEDRCRYYRSLRDNLEFDVNIKFSSDGLEFTAIKMLELPSNNMFESLGFFDDILQGYEKSGFKVEMSVI